MLNKVSTALIDIIIPGASVSTIWGLSISDWDHATKIAGTILITAVTVTLAILRHRKKK